MNYWFTADLHLGHENIIKYENRPFKSLWQMNETLIKNWNSRVAEDDTVFHVGDFCFKNSSKVVGRGEGDIKASSEYEKLLNGKIIFIRGNHDNNNSTRTPIERIVLEGWGGKRILLIHNPNDITAWDKFDFVFCGHIHKLWKEKIIHNMRVINVGVDVRKFMPMSFDELIKKSEDDGKKEA